MPKHTSVEVLRRWQDMDLLLSRGRLHVVRFAEKWKVDERTIRRDLEAFKALGLPSERARFDWEKYGLKENDYTALWELAKNDPSNEDFDSNGPYLGYKKGQRPLFTANLPQ